jgi:hypothetical protein
VVKVPSLTAFQVLFLTGELLANLFQVLFQAPLQTSKMVATDCSTDFLCDALRSMWLDDPHMTALYEGKISWGDIPGLANTRDESDSESEQEQEEEQEQEPIQQKEQSRYRKSVESSDSDGWEQVGTSKKCPPVFDETQSIPFTPGIRTIIARNLPRDIKLDTLRNIFDKYGPICDIYIPKNADKSSNLYGTIKGFALIKFLKPEDAAIAFMDKYRRIKIGSNIIHLESAKMDR